MAGGRDKTSQYHKEDLRGDLVKAGLAYVEEHGHETLSVRKLAAMVGVSPGAPYHHFPDRRALLLALALDGYGRLNAQGGARHRNLPDPVDHLVAVSLQFLAFSSRHPRLFELMYESELTRPVLDPSIEKARFAGFSLLRNALARVAPSLPEVELTTRLLAVWSSLYGFATLRNKQMIKPLDMGPAAAESVVRWLVATVTI